MSRLTFLFSVLIVPAAARQVAAPWQGLVAVDDYSDIVGTAPRPSYRERLTT